MSRGKAFLGAALCTVALVLLGLIGWAEDLFNNAWFLYLCLIPVAGILYFRFRDRCPHCKQFLFRQPLYIRHCPHCGEPL